MRARVSGTWGGMTISATLIGGASDSSHSTIGFSTGVFSGPASSCTKNEKPAPPSRSVDHRALRRRFSGASRSADSGEPSGPACGGASVDVGTAMYLTARRPRA